MCSCIFVGVYFGFLDILDFFVEVIEEFDFLPFENLVVEGVYPKSIYNIPTIHRNQFCSEPWGWRPFDRHSIRKQGFCLWTFQLTWNLERRRRVCFICSSQFCDRPNNPSSIWKFFHGIDHFLPSSTKLPISGIRPNQIAWDNWVLEFRDGKSILQVILHGGIQHRGDRNPREDCGI